MNFRSDERFKIAENWRGRGVAFFRFAIFVFSYVALNLALNYLLAGVQSHIKALEIHFLIAMISIAAAVLFLTALMAHLSGLPFGMFGYGGTHRARNFCIGVCCGVLSLAVQLGTLSTLGFLSWGSDPVDFSLVGPAAIFAALFLVVAVAEEGIFRGYALVELSRAISFWPAALLLGLLFGAFHWVKGGGENMLGGMNALAAGLAFAFSFRMTGSLWLAVGCHAGWNYAESFVFGVPNSANVFAAHVLHASIRGPDWLGGGAVGPEGSVFAFLMPVAVAFIGWRYLRSAKELSCGT